MGDFTEKRKLKESEIFAMQQGEEAINSYRSHMFKGQFDQGQYAQGESLIEYYEQKGIRLSEQEKEILKSSAIAAPKFEPLSEEAYRGKSSCSKSSYRKKVKNYYKERNARRLRQLEGEDEKKRMAYNDAIYDIELRLMQQQFANEQVGENGNPVQEQLIHVEAPVQEKDLANRPLTPKEIAERSQKRITKKFEETTELIKGGATRVMYDRPKNASDQKEWDKDYETYGDSYYNDGHGQKVKDLFPKGTPDLSDLKQGYESNCYLYSALAGLVVTNPAYITRELIRLDPGDMNYCIVKLYDADANARYIRVENTYKKTDANWSHLVMKAAAVLIWQQNGGAVYRDSKDSKNKQVLKDRDLSISDLNNGSEELASMLFFGAQGKLLSMREKLPEDAFAYSEDPIYDGQERIDGDNAIGELLAYIDAGKIVVSSTCGSDHTYYDDEYRYVSDTVCYHDTKLKSKHAYWIMGEGFPDPVTKQRTLRVRDPYGNVGENGIIDITFDEFKKYFTNAMIMDSRENGVV